MSTEIIVINDSAQPQVAAGCRALQYGDGVFTTLAVKNGQPQLWSLHLARLQLAVTRLALPAPDWHVLTETVAQHAAQFTAPTVIKLLLSRGIGGRGYAPHQCHHPIVYLYTAAMPDYQHWQQHGLRVGVAKLRLAIQPALAGLKHTNRLEQVLLKQELAQTSFDDLLVVDQQQHLTEATAANVFYQWQGQWFTPPLHLAGVAGVMRQHIMANLAGCQERVLQVSDIKHVQAMFLTNALLGIAPINSIEGYALPIAAVQQIQQEILC